MKPIDTIAARKALDWLPADGSWRRQDMHAPVPALNVLRTTQRGCESTHDGKGAMWRLLTAGYDEPCLRMVVAGELL